MSNSYPEHPPLDQKDIQACLTRLCASSRIRVFNTLPSTQTYLQHQTPQTSPNICVAEAQTQGRGRCGQRMSSWHSPHGQNIYLSQRQPQPPTTHSWEGFGLALAVMFCETLERSFKHFQPLQLKWPNDILHQHQKCAGLLIETQAGLKTTDLIVGLGLNVHMTTAPEADLQPWTSLTQISPQPWDRNPLCAQLIEVIDQCIHDYAQTGLSTYLDRWSERDVLKGRWLRISQPRGELKGQAMGLSEQGYLKVRDEAGVVHTLISAQASIHCVDG